MWLAGAALLLVAGGVGAWWALRHRGSEVTTARSLTPRPGALTERSARVPGPSRVVDAAGATVAPEPLPTDVIDYLRFLKDVERQRVLLIKQQLGDLLKQSGDLTYSGARADWTTNEPEQRYRETYGRFQQSLASWSAQWQQLSQAFLAYPKPVPPSCTDLKNKYYDMLGKTSGSIVKVGSNFAQALSGDASKALESLSGMQGSGLGSASKDVADACSAADDALGEVCERHRLHKDFDIRDEAGGGNLLGR